MTAVNEIQIEDRAIPAPGPLQAVVRIEAVGVCGSDHSYFVRGGIGDYYSTKRPKRSRSTSASATR
jgi:L-iditol 2-dehydrogenase